MNLKLIVENTKKIQKPKYKDIEKKFGSFSGRYFVDSAPVLERDWAKRAGLGWIGKNTMLRLPVICI